MKQVIKRLALAGCIPLVGSCGMGESNTFTLTADMPPNFRYVGAVYYVPDKGETCTVATSKNKAPVFNYKWRTHYKPDSKILIRRTRDGCRLVVSRIALEINATYGDGRNNYSGSTAGVFIRYDTKEQYKGTFDARGESEFHGQCHWSFRTMGPKRYIVKLLDCRGVDAQGNLSRYRPGAAYHPDEISGKVVRLKIQQADAEAPSIGDTWVKVLGGWKRCMGRGFEDQDAYCFGNFTDFSNFYMPDGQLCSIYPGCQE